MPKAIIRRRASEPDPATGNLLGVLCGLAWALTLLGLRWSERDGARDGMSAVVVGNAIACVVGLPFLASLPAASPIEWATTAYLGVFQIAIAYMFLTSGVARVPALDVSPLLLIEPVLNPIWTWLVRGEEPGARTLVGGAIIITATAAKGIHDARSPAITTKDTKSANGTQGTTDSSRSG